MTHLSKQCPQLDEKLIRLCGPQLFEYYYKIDPKHTTIATYIFMNNGFLENLCWDVRIPTKLFYDVLNIGLCFKDH